MRGKRPLTCQPHTHTSTDTHNHTSASGQNKQPISANVRKSEYNAGEFLKGNQRMSLIPSELRIGCTLVFVDPLFSAVLLLIVYHLHSLFFRCQKLTCSDITRGQSHPWGTVLFAFGICLCLCVLACLLAIVSIVDCCEIFTIAYFSTPVTPGGGWWWWWWWVKMPPLASVQFVCQYSQLRRCNISSGRRRKDGRMWYNVRKI